VRSPTQRSTPEGPTRFADVTRKLESPAELLDARTRFRSSLISAMTELSLVSKAQNPLNCKEIGLSSYARTTLRLLVSGRRGVVGEVYGVGAGG